MSQVTNDSIRKAVREQYTKVALAGDAGCGCSSTSCCDTESDGAKTASIKLGYSDSDVNQVPEGSNMGLGCGNPRAIASLKSGETVLDLGSGGGFDCFLAVEEVGPSGRVIGVDMTPEMISRARRNAADAGHDNIDFRLGEIESLPVADSLVDVVISNCVINLSPDKSKVFGESFRVLKPGGRIAVSDVVATADLPEEVLSDMSMFTGCMAGASTIGDYERILEEVGFVDVSIQPKDESRDFIRTWAPGSRIEDYVVSATIEATKSRPSKGN
ncbi:MAG: arsenite methyltransferase [Verrucomicrobiota bacterium]